MCRDRSRIDCRRYGCFHAAASTADRRHPRGHAHRHRGCAGHAQALDVPACRRGLRLRRSSSWSPASSRSAPSRRRPCRSRAPVRASRGHPSEVAALPIRRDRRADRAGTFPEPKARQIHAIAVRVRVDEYGGELPCDGAVMLEFTGVGPKCANLALGIACGQPTIGGRHPRPPGHQPLGLRPREDAGADDGGARAEAAERVPGRDQPAAGAVRQVHLHRRHAALLVLPAHRHLPEDRRHERRGNSARAQTTQSKSTSGTTSALAGPRRSAST